MTNKRPRDMTIEELRALPELTPSLRTEWGDRVRMQLLDDSRSFKTEDGRDWETVMGPDESWYRMEIDVLTIP